MQFLISVISDSTEPASDTEAAAIDVFNDGLQKAGNWVFAGGMPGPADAKTIDNREDRGLITDGPFAESKEYIAGFWIINADSRDEALRLAYAGSKACNRKVELRRFHDEDDAAGA
jgi:hypothetical protein